ncbi:MAG: hypothetical protein SGCHY_000982 [Lobulomycetales sp.]
MSQPWNRIAKTASGKQDNVAHVKGVNFYRDAKAVKLLNMYRGGKPTRDRKGKIVVEAQFQKKLASGTVARVQADRRYFENVRVIGQKELDNFREAMADKKDDAYTVLLRQNKLPMSLITDHAKVAKMNMLECDPFSTTFGPKAQRKRPKLAFSSVTQMGTEATHRTDENYDAQKDGQMLANTDASGVSALAADKRMNAGQSRRIWKELYKVVDSSDVLIHVLDARDPVGTRCTSVEKYVAKEAPHKHLIFVLNKCDLVPTWVTSKWIKHLSKDRPTLAFHASINHSFGKGSLITLLRQFAKLHKDKKQISVGFIGYPNTGKSSIINTLKKEKVCNVAPIPGETKVWQYISLMSRIYLIDCPGVVQPGPDESQTSIVLKGVVRIESLVSPEEHIPALLARVKREYLVRTYGVDGEWEDEMDFLCQLARMGGRLNKGGEPDTHTVAKMILGDWVRGNIPYFSLPPGVTMAKKVDAKAEDEAKTVEEESDAKTVEAKAVEVEDKTVEDKAVEVEDKAVVEEDKAVVEEDNPPDDRPPSEK